MRKYIPHHNLRVVLTRSNSTAAGAASDCAVYLRVQAGVSLSAMVSPTSLADGVAAPRSINTTFAGGNRGFQTGTITGHVNAEFHHHAPGTVGLQRV